LEQAVTPPTDTAVWSPAAIDAAAQAHIDGLATPEQVAKLTSDQTAWLASLWRLLDAADAALERARRDYRGPERALVLEDLDDECYRIDAAITALVGPPTPEELGLPPQPPAPEPVQPGVTQLQLSSAGGQLIAWSGGHNADMGSAEVTMGLLAAIGGGDINWQECESVKVPGSPPAPAVSAPLTAALGWLVGQANSSGRSDIGVSVQWLGLAAASAVEHVAQGRFVLSVSALRGRAGGDGGLAPFEVRWIPALTDADALDELVAAVPGAAMVGHTNQDRAAFTKTTVADIVHAIVATACAKVEVPAPPPDPRTRNDVGEMILGHLNGTVFEVPTRPGTEIANRLKEWAKPVTGVSSDRLIVQLDPPDESNGWFAQVLAHAERGNGVEPVEIAANSHSKSRSRHLRAELDRLEMMFPALLRPGGRRRGQVILSQDEAWRLMSEEGRLLSLAGFELRVPALAPKKATAALRLTSEEQRDSVVGAQQLANVRWSVVFDDVELTAEDIAKLALEARPLVRSHGTWVEIDQVDLVAAAAALAERANITKLSGADMLRHALGLEGNPLAGGFDISGEGWAVELLRGIQNLPEHPETKPKGFKGELRSYQADALSWLNFLDDAGLGGCLALDMGLGKTPTALASFVSSSKHGTGLVIAPPAVVGNWATEAKAFVPGLKVHIHHGASRATGEQLRKIIERVDLVITTYGLAVREMDELAKVTWSKVVIDEAQAIKNPAAEVSQQLRRLDARTRVALTGTPIENGLGDLWSIMDWANPGLVGDRNQFVAQLTPDAKNKGRGDNTEDALKALNGVLVYRRTKTEPEIAAELPDRIDELDRCAMTTEQIGLYQAVIDSLVVNTSANEPGSPERKGAVLAAITALKQICNHPVNYLPDDDGLDGRSGKLARLNEIMESVYASGEKMLIFTHFATWGERLADYLTDRTGKPVHCYHGGLSRTARDTMVSEFESSEGAGALVLSLKAGGTGLNLTAANHVVLYDRWWNPAVEDQARDRVWRIGQTKTVICHRLVCPGTVDERVEEIVAGKRHIADMVLPKSSSIASLDASELQQALGINPDLLMVGDDAEVTA
jgi:hypothetical protein